MTGVYIIAVVFGLAISVGLYFIFFWPGREPDEAGQGDDGDAGDRGRGDRGA